MQSRCGRSGGMPAAPWHLATPIVRRRDHRSEPADPDVAIWCVRHMATSGLPGRIGVITAPDDRIRPPKGRGPSGTSASAGTPALVRHRPCRLVAVRLQHRETGAGGRGKEPRGRVCPMAVTRRVSSGRPITTASRAEQVRHGAANARRAALPSEIWIYVELIELVPIVHEEPPRSSACATRRAMFRVSSSRRGSFIA